MGKFDGILICTDLDGTLYRKDKSVSYENRSAIEYFKREGGYFTFITGRMPYYSMDAYDAANPNVPFGCANGGAVYDGAAGEYIWKQEISRDVFELVDCIDRELPDIGIQVCGFEKTYFHNNNTESTEWIRRVTKLPRLIKHYREVDEPISKIIFSTEVEENIIKLEKTLRAHPLADRFGFVRSESRLFEIMPKGVDKGLALKKLVEHLGVDVRKTIGIGDYDNDLGMFREAGVGIAVANASAAAKAAADRITVSNEEHAIAQVISDIENGILL